MKRHGFSVQTSSQRDPGCLSLPLNGSMQSIVLSHTPNSLPAELRGQTRREVLIPLRGAAVYCIDRSFGQFALRWSQSKDK